MAERDAQVAQHRAVAEVALEAADRQLLAEVREQRVGQAEVAFGILEVDRVDLVRHRRRADLAGARLLPEVAQRDVAPGVAAPVDQHRVAARNGVEQLGHRVVRLDLGRVGVEGQPQPLLDDVAGEALPVEVGPGRQVRVVVADRAVHLGQQPHAVDALARRDQAGDDVGELLADRRRACRLAVRAREHRLPGVGLRQAAQALDHGVERGQQHLAARGPEHQRMRGVVDVLAGAGKVHELGGRAQLGVGRKARLEPVLDGLDVVVGDALDVLDGLRVGLAEVGDQPAQQAAGVGRQRLELGQAGVGQRHEPLDLDLHAAVHQPELGQQRPQRSQLGRVAAVQRRQGSEGRRRHRATRQRAWRAGRRF